MVAALSELGGFGSSLVAFSSHGLAQLIALVRSGACPSGAFRPLGSPGWEKPDRPGEGLRAQALEPGDSNPLSLCPLSLALTSSRPCLPQGLGDAEEHQGARPVCHPLLLPSPRGVIIFQGGTEPQHLHLLMSLGSSQDPSLRPRLRMQSDWRWGEHSQDTTYPPFLSWRDLLLHSSQLSSLLLKFS